MSTLNNQNLAPKVLRASAGSGKTYQLSNRYLQLLLMGEMPDRILASTFTKKAAGEIRDRILKRLVEGSENDDTARQLSKELGIGTQSAKVIRESLKRFISFQHRALICTLDSFFTSLAKSFSHEMGLPSKWQILEESYLNDLLDDAVRDVCAESERVSELLNLLQGSQGSRRIHSAILSKVSQLKDLVYTTDKACWSFENKFKPSSQAALQSAQMALIDFPVPLTKEGTPNKAFKNALDAIIEKFIVGGRWEEDVLKNTGTFLEKIINDEEKFSRATIPPELKEIFSSIVNQIRFKLSSDLSERTLALRLLLEEMVGFYEKQKAAQSAVSFDDIKRLVYEAALTNDLAEIFFRIDSRISHILLDEFQDTSLVEWRLLEPIADEILAYSDGSHSFFCVGDTKQSIYGFRGGVAEIFDNLESRWDHLSIERMEISRRSSQTVLDFVNLIFKDLENNKALDKYTGAAHAWQKRFDRHEAHNKEAKGFVSFVASNLALGQEAIALAAAEIKRLHQQNPDLTIGVLVRRQFQLGNCLYELNKLGIEASGEGGTALTDSPVVSVILSFLWLMDHPGDSISHFHVASSPLAGVFNLSKADSLEDIESVTAKYRNKLLDSGLQALLTDIQQKIKDLCSKRDALKVQKLIETAIKFKSNSIRVSEFVRAARKIKVLDPEQSHVRVMTIHKSKGLEFDAVFLCDLDFELSPTSSRKSVLIAKESALSEPSQITAAVTKEVRSLFTPLEVAYEQQKSADIVDSLSVLYVALTRARYALYLYTDNKSNKLTASKLMKEALKSPGLTPGEIYSDGDENWFKSLSGNEAKTSEEVRIRKISFSSDQKYGARNLPRVTPSNNLESYTFNVHNEKSLLSRNRGVIMHKLFETVEWLGQKDKSIISKEDLRAWCIKEHVFNEKVMDAAMQSFSEVLENSAVAKLLSLDNYKDWKCEKVAVVSERAFASVIDKKLHVGTIDRLVLGSSSGKVLKAEVIDYKTDQVAENNMPEHSRQLGYYMAAICDIYKLAPEAVTAKVVFITTAEVREIKL